MIVNNRWIALYLLICFLTIIFSSCQNETATRPPNVLLIISDDQAWSDYGFMGHSHIQTPRLDQLASESLCFTRGYATAPLCSPSLATILSGRYAHVHGVTGNDPIFQSDKTRYSTEWRKERFDHYKPFKEKYYQQKILTQYLKEAGYRSLQTGKWWLGSWKDAHFDAGMTHGDPARDGRHGDEGLKIGREGLDTIFSFIEQSQMQEKPFFIWYAPFLPHTPHNPPERLLNKYLSRTKSEYLAKYWAMCEWFDETCGTLIDHLQASGLDEETLIIYTTDNGWIQNIDRNGYAPRSKRTPYEKGIRTPFMLRWPGVLDPRIDTTTLVSNIDIVPTILGVAGIPASTPLPGTDLLNPEILSKRKTIFAETFAHDMPDINDPAKGLQYRIALEYPWKLIVPDTANSQMEKVELFNIEEDPLELKELSVEYGAIVKNLEKKLDDWWMRDLD